MEKQNIFMMLVLVILSLTFVVGYQESLGFVSLGEDVELIQTCSVCPYVTLDSVKLPNGTIITVNENMTKTGSTFSYTFNQTENLGVYIYNTYYGNYSSPISFEVTPTGEETNGWRITIQIFAALSTLIFSFLFMYLSTSGLKQGHVSREEKPAIRILFIGIALVFLVAHILITNVIIHDTLGTGVIAGAYTNVMYIFFTVIIAIFLFTLIKIIIYEMDLFQRRLGLR